MPPTDLDSPPAAPTAPERTFSLEDAATIICGDSSAASQDWLVQRLRGTKEPRLSGYKVGRRWRMTQTDIDNAINTLRPQPATIHVTSMTARSRRRIAVPQ